MQDDLKLTKLERIFLINQLRILEALYPREAEKLSIQREAFECGYELLYGLWSEYIADGDDKMAAEECQEVFNTMDMFDAIGRSKPDDLDVSEFPMTKFSGYDGNNETKFMAFAQFVVERWGRFQYLQMREPRGWNAHQRVRNTYRQMLAIWTELPHDERFSMSPEQLKSVLSAAYYSEN